MPKRKIFSRKDGTTIKEDVTAINEEIHALVQGLPGRVKKLLPEAEDFVVGVEYLATLIKEGSEVDIAINQVLDILPIKNDSAIYHKVRDYLAHFAIQLRIAFEKAEQISNIKLNTASQLVRAVNDIDVSVIDSNLAVELAVFYQFNAA